MNEQLAQRLAHDWITAWNRHDVLISPSLCPDVGLPAHLYRRYPPMRPEPFGARSLRTYFQKGSMPTRTYASISSAS